ncbi:hypothetical protein C8Q72DRAFT_106539 [Fomitopsis betulina]|nr:hypothetical protein C8Q72DRAFT_106539 [Fomitopsis betulina]
MSRYCNGDSYSEVAQLHAHSWLYSSTCLRVLSREHTRALLLTAMNMLTFSTCLTVCLLRIAPARLGLPTVICPGNEPEVHRGVGTLGVPDLALVTVCFTTGTGSPVNGRLLQRFFVILIKLIFMFDRGPKQRARFPSDLCLSYELLRRRCLQSRTARW